MENEWYPIPLPVESGSSSKLKLTHAFHQTSLCHHHRHLQSLQSRPFSLGRERTTARVYDFRRATELAFYIQPSAIPR